jgi:hypothetical protein
MQLGIEVLTGGRRIWHRKITTLSLSIAGYSSYKLLEKWVTLPRHLSCCEQVCHFASYSLYLALGMPRNFGGIANPRLYSKSRTGTKQLVEDFIEELTVHIRSFCHDIDHLDNHIEIRQRIEFLKSLRHSLGNTALLLSGGGSLGIYHIGVLEALLEAGVFPRIIAGSSAGSIIAALICTRTEDEYEDLIKFKDIAYNFIEPPLENWSWLRDLSRKFHRMVHTGVVFDPEHLKSTLRANLGEFTFLVRVQLRGSSHVCRRRFRRRSECSTLQ